MVESFVCPVPLGLLEGVVEVRICLAPVIMGGGESDSCMGDAAHIVPPVYALWVWVAFQVKGEVAGLLHCGIESVDLSFEGFGGCRQSV